MGISSWKVSWLLGVLGIQAGLKGSADPSSAGENQKNTPEAFGGFVIEPGDEGMVKAAGGGSIFGLREPPIYFLPSCLEWTGIAGRSLGLKEKNDLNN